MTNKNQPLSYISFPPIGEKFLFQADSLKAGPDTFFEGTIAEWRLDGMQSDPLYASVGMLVRILRPREVWAWVPRNVAPENCHVAQTWENIDDAVGAFMGKDFDDISNHALALWVDHPAESNLSFSRRATKEELEDSAHRVAEKMARLIARDDESWDDEDWSSEYWDE